MSEHVCDECRDLSKVTDEWLVKHLTEKMGIEKWSWSRNMTISEFDAHCDKSGVPDNCRVPKSKRLDGGEEHAG